jgi:ELWxxDGT repeat protein
VYFTAADSTRQRALWKTDGSAEGTSVVKYVYDGPQIRTGPTSLTVAGGLLYFTADDGVHGTELWQSDGTPEGTVLVADLAEGSSSPRNLTVVNDRLLFSASSRDYGWALFAAAPEVGGDYSHDGRVDGSDLLAWQRGVGTTVAAPGDGADGNDNGRVDRTDLVIWQNNFGRDFAAAADYDQNGRTDGRDLLAWQRAVGSGDARADGDRSGAVDSGDLDYLLSLLAGGGSEGGAEAAAARGATGESQQNVTKGDLGSAPRGGERAPQRGSEGGSLTADGLMRWPLRKLADRLVKAEPADLWALDEAFESAGGLSAAAD